MYWKGLRIAGFGGSPKYNKRGYCQYTEEDVAAFIKNLGHVDIFLAHSNPVVEWYKSPNVAHNGFKSFNEYIEKNEPTYFLHGHLHESKQYVLNKTEVFSVYPQELIILK